MSDHYKLLKVASEQLQRAGDVIEQLASYAMQLEQKLAARDVAIKLASAGRVPLAELQEKVAEFEQRDPEDLEMEEKLASYSAATPEHNIADPELGGNQNVSLLDIIS